MKRAFQICLGITLLEFIVSIAVFKFLPQTIPTHWGVSGNIDAYGSKWMIFLSPVISLLLTFGIYFIPKVDPKKENIMRSGRAFPATMILLTLVFLVVEAVTIFASFGYNVSVAKILPAAIGIMFIFLGNYMPKVKPNYLFGIRFPWTLANETVWVKTHRLGGWVFFFMGVLFIAGIFIPAPYNFILPLGGVFLGIILLFIYSYFEYKKINK